MRSIPHKMLKAHKIEIGSNHTPDFVYKTSELKNRRENPSTWPDALGRTG